MDANDRQEEAKQRTVEHHTKQPLKEPEAYPITRCSHKLENELTN